MDEEDNNYSKLFYTLLKMRDLFDLNNLYNAQDVILLCESFENRFQAMFEKSGFNLRKCISASKLSGCIPRERSKINYGNFCQNSDMWFYLHQRPIIFQYRILDAKLDQYRLQKSDY